MQWAKVRNQKIKISQKFLNFCDSIGCTANLDKNVVLQSLKCTTTKFCSTPYFCAFFSAVGPAYAGKIIMKAISNRILPLCGEKCSKITFLEMVKNIKKYFKTFKQSSKLKVEFYLYRKMVYNCWITWNKIKVLN